MKVYEAGFDLISLANKVYALEIDGLIWNKEPKILEVAYGVQKLQVGCVIEDDKVLTDDIFDKITAWEDDVQSVDMISMQKLWFFVLYDSFTLLSTLLSILSD